MLILGIDTSDGVGVALLRTGEILARAAGADPRRHAETLAPGIAWVLAEAGADRRDLDAVAVGTGPAPFTGLRVGLVTARALSRALGIPAYGICSLDALARQAFDEAGRGGPVEVLAATDARRREVYAARYVRRAGAEGDDVERLAGPVVASPGDVRAALGMAPGAAGGPGGPDPVAGPGAGAYAGGLAVVGRGAHLYPDVLAPSPGPRAVDAAVLARLAVWRAQHDGEVDLEPRYLRRPDVSPPAARKRAS